MFSARPTKVEDLLILSEIDSRQTVSYDIGSTLDTGIYGTILGMSITNFGLMFNMGIRSGSADR